MEMEVGGIKLEQVKSFKYLGVRIQNNWRQEAEIKERISAASSLCMLCIEQKISKGERNYRKDQSKCVKAIFSPILTCGSENWVLTRNVRSKIQAAEMKYLRRIKKIIRRDRVRYEIVRQEPKLKPMLKKIQKRQLKWFGHLMRMDNARFVKKVRKAKMAGKRKEDSRGKHGKIQYRTF